MLDDEIRAVRELVEPGRTLLRAVVDLVPRTVESCTLTQQLALARISALAERRVRRQEEWRARLGLPEDGVRLSKLLDRLPGGDDPELRRKVRDLQALYDETARHTSRLGSLLQSAVAWGRDFLGLIAGLDLPPAAYNRAGRPPAPPAALPLFERTA